MDEHYAAVGAPWPDGRAFVSQPMAFSIRKSKIGRGADESEREGADRAAQVTKRNKRSNRRNAGGHSQPGDGAGHITTL